MRFGITGLSNDGSELVQATSDVAAIIELSEPEAQAHRLARNPRSRRAEGCKRPRRRMIPTMTPRRASSDILWTRRRLHKMWTLVLWAISIAIYSAFRSIFDLLRVPVAALLRASHLRGSAGLLLAHALPSGALPIPLRR